MDVPTDPTKEEVSHDAATARFAGDFQQAWDEAVKLHKAKEEDGETHKAKDEDNETQQAKDGANNKSVDGFPFARK